MDIKYLFNNNSKYLIIIFVIILAIVYRTYSPSESIYFPKCPFRQLTGLKCPGCGAQRCVHYLLNFDIYNAIKANAMLTLFLPYIITGIAFDLINPDSKKILKWQNRLFGENAIMVILTLIISFWIFRNILNF